MAFDRDDLPRVEFARNPLKVAVVQLRFPPVFALAQPAGLAALQQGLAVRYPLASAPDQIVTVSVGPEGIGQPVAGSGPVRFTDEQNEWTVAVSADALSLETTRYRSWMDFSARWAEILEALRATAAPVRISRLGLRFINELHHPEAQTIGEWRRLLAPDFVGTPGSALVSEFVTQAVEQISLAYEDDRITLRHGFRVGSAETGESTYLIDIDVFSDQLAQFEPDEVISKLERYHRWAWNLFRSSLTDDMVTALQEETR